MNLKLDLGPGLAGTVPVVEGRHFSTRPGAALSHVRALVLSSYNSLSGADTGGMHPPTRPKKVLTCHFDFIENHH